MVELAQEDLPGAVVRRRVVLHRHEVVEVTGVEAEEPGMRAQVLAHVGVWPAQVAAVADDAPHAVLRLETHCRRGQRGAARAAASHVGRSRVAGQRARRDDRQRYDGDRQDSQHPA
jgi:hypothetical protein